MVSLNCDTVGGGLGKILDPLSSFAILLNNLVVILGLVHLSVNRIFSLIVDQILKPAITDDRLAGCQKNSL